MLSSITVHGRAPVSADCAWVTNRPLNFLFGENGSGKTTISRYLAGDDPSGLEWADGVPQRILVYNRDVVDKTIREPERMPGVFLLGEPDVSAQTELQDLLGVGDQKGKLDLAEDDRKSREAALNACTARLEVAEQALTEAVWAAYRVTSRWVVEFLDTVQVSGSDYAARSSGMGVTSSIDWLTGVVMVVNSSMEASEK